MSTSASPSATAGAATPARARMRTVSETVVPSESASALREDISSVESMTWSWTGLGMGLPGLFGYVQGVTSILGKH